MHWVMTGISSFNETMTAIAEELLASCKLPFVNLRISLLLAARVAEKFPLPSSSEIFNTNLPAMIPGLTLFLRLTMQKCSLSFAYNGKPQSLQQVYSFQAVFNRWDLYSQLRLFPIGFKKPLR